MKIFPLCLLVLAASEPCYDDCNSQDTDEVQLLQVRSDGQKQIPGLDKLVDSVSQAVGAARKIADEGIGQVTTQLTSALDKAELEISSATQKFNTSIINFHAQANEADTVAQNFTKLQKLVADTVGNLIPCYTATLDNVKGAVAATKTILSSIGQKDVLEKLETCQGTAVEKFTQLADTTSAMGMQIANSASMKVGEALDILRSQTAKAAELSKDLKWQFHEKIETFVGSLQGPLTVALGEEAPERISGLTAKVDTVFGQFNALLNLINTELPKCAETVDTQLELARHRGFWSHIFGGIFGR